MRMVIMPTMKTRVPILETNIITMKTKMTMASMNDYFVIITNADEPSYDDDHGVVDATASPRY